MPDFDPNEYLKNQSQSKGFDPNKYLEENPIEKKNLNQNASPIGTQTSNRGFEPFQSQVDTETPSVLTTVESDNARMVRRTRMQQQNRKPLLDFSAIKNAPKPKDAYYQDPTIAAREEKARLKSRKEEYERGEIDRNTFVQDLDYVAALGIDMVGRMASTLPSAILDNAISSFGNQFGGLAQTGVDAEMIGQYVESATGLPQEYNPLSPNNFLAEKFRQKAELNQSLARKGYNGSITDALAMGKYKDAAKLTALGFTESLPILLGMAATRGAGLSGNGSLLSLGLGTQGTTYQDLKKENPEIAKNILLLNATLTAIGEAGSEVTGTNMLYNQARKLFVKGQKEEAKKIVTKGIKDYLDYAFQKSFVGSAVLGDASGEVANQVWKNATDKWSGVRPDVDYLDGVGDAAIISMATTSVIASGAKALASVVNPKIKEKVDKEADKIKDLQKEADNPNIPDEVKVVLANEIANSTEIINESLKEDNEAYNKLDDDQKTEIDSLSDKKQRIEEVLTSESVSDTSKEALQKELGKINSQIDAIIKKKPPIDPPAIGGAMVEETETQALVESKVVPLEKPTIDTEEQIIAEGQQAETDFQATDDLVSYEQKMKELDDRANQLIEAPTEITEAPQRERASHKIVKSEDNTTLDDMTKGGELVPDDFYDKPQFYTDINNKASKESLSVIKKAKGNPDAEITIYRSVPQGVENIEEGDWISLSPTYAKEHGMHPTDETQDMPVISMKVKAKDIVWDGNDVNEFAYFPVSKPTKPQTDAIQVETAGQVPVLTEAPVGEEVEQGKPQPKAKVVTEEGKEEVTPAQEVARLRAEEQAELNAAIPNADQYLTDGKVDRAKITDAKDLEAFDKIYDKYDRLITPLLPKKEEPSKTDILPKYKKKSIAEWFNKGLNATSIFEGGEIHPEDATKRAAWRSMGGNEFIKLLGGEEIGGETKKGGYFGDNPAIASAQKGEGKYLVEFGGKRVEFETTVGKVSSKDVTGVWKYENGSWNKLSKENVEDLIPKEQPKKEAKVEEVERTEFDNEEDAELYDISRETDPNVIADKYYRLPSLENTDYKGYQLAQAILGKRPYKVSLKEWTEYGGDKSQEDLKKYKRFIKEGKGDIDDVTGILTDRFGVEVTPEDIVGTIINYGNKSEFNRKGVSNVEQALLERYFDLTGKMNITEAAAKKGFDAVNKKNKASNKLYVQKEALQEAGITEEDIAKEQEFASEGFGELETPLEKFEYQKKQISKKGKTELEIKKEIFAKAKEMAAAIRGAKIDGKGKAFDATLGLPVAIWNGAIETVATAIEAGVAVADAIKRGLNYIQKNNRGVWNKKAYNDRVIAELGLRGIEVNGTDLIVQPLEDKATVELVNGFYSPLEKGIAEAKTDKATGKGWMKVLSGVTEADELNYTGVKDFLNSNADRPISRKELLDYMKNNRIEVVEVVLGAKEALSKEAMDDVYNGINEQLSRTNQPDEIVEFVDEKLNDWYNNPSDKNYKSLYAALGEVNLSLDDFIESAEDRMDDTKFSQYQLEGEKENYKELLVTLPKRLPSDSEKISNEKAVSKYNTIVNEENAFLEKLGGMMPTTEQRQVFEDIKKRKEDAKNQLPKDAQIVNNGFADIGEKLYKRDDFKSSHFDEPNILVHLRINTRTDVDGNKVLFLEEVQSDWGQKGKREGFATTNAEKRKKELLAKDELTKSELDELDSLNKELGFSTKIPTAPFVTDTNAWTKLGLKTALKEAVAQGADKLAWTTGEQQNDRYSLENEVDFVKKRIVNGETFIDIKPKNTDGIIFKVDSNGNILENKGRIVAGAIGKNISEVIGKDVSERILLADKDSVLEGEGLKVGGKGMKGFYGSPTEESKGIIGGLAEKLFGQKLGTVEINKGTDGLTKDEALKLLNQGEKIYTYSRGTMYRLYDIHDINEATNYFSKKGEATSTQYSIDITPELKQAVKEGIPLFKNELTQAKGKLKEASAALSNLNKNLGIYSDPEQNAKALFEYHKALVGLAKAYIKAGVNSVKDFAKELGENLTQEIKDAWNEANGGKKKVESDFEEKVKEKEVSGIKKALVSDEIIESVNLDKISDKEMNELGKKLVETGEIKPSNIVLSIAKGTPRALQPKEVVALIYYKTTLDNKRRELLSEYNKNVANGESVADVAIELDEVQTNIELYDVMAVITANQQSLAFRLRKSLRDKDYNLVTQIEQYKKVNGGIIPAEVEAKFRELDKQLTELKDKLKDAEQRAIEAEEVKSVKNIVEDIERTNSTTKKGSLTPQEKARKKELAKKYNVFNDVTRIVTILAEKDFREYARLVFKESKGDFIEFGRELIKNVGSGIKDFLPNLYKELGGKGDANISELTQQPFVKDGELVIPPAFIRDAVEQGNTDINTLAEAVKKIVEGELPNITIRAVRDAITKYGRTVNQTKDVVQQQINEAKRLGRLYSELEDLQNKKAKEKSGKVFNKISDKERELKRKIKILERAIPPTPEVLEQTELQRSNARKEYLKRFIQEKKDRLSKGNFAPKPKVTPVRKDSEIIALETEANKIRDEYDAAHYDNEQANRSTFNKIKDTAVEWGTGISRALVAGLDFGFFLVQGIISIGSTNPLKTLYAINQSLLAGLGTNANPITETRRYFRELGSEKVEREQLANLKAQPYYPIMKASGLSIQEPNAKLGERDDALQASVINKIWNFAMLPIKYINPKAYEVAVKANPYRAGERAYTGASNAIRVQMFLDFAIALEKKGITFEDSPELYKIAANTANNMTFRGRLRFAEPIAAQLNMLYFSSRKVTASLSLVNPAYWVDLGVRNPIVAKQALLKMATFIGVATSVTLALQAFSDDDDEEQNPDMFNPYSSDFMTYRIGNTRLNFFGGLGGNVVLFARFLTGNYKTTSSSKMKKLGQDSFTPNRKELLETTLFANKLNPMAGTGYAFLNQSIGREIDWEDEAISSVSPLWAQNISELQREHPYVMASFLSYMSFLGQSINTYGTPEFIDREKDKELFNFIQSKNVSFSEKTRSNVDVLDINTGELREVTKDEFEIFKKEYADYIKNHIKDNLKELSRMPVSKVETEMTKLKTNATKYAKEIISGVAKEVITIEKDDVIYKLTPAQIKERKALNKEYIDEFGEDIIEAQTEIAIEEGKSPQEAKIIAEKKLKSLANANSKIELLDKYTDDNDNITLKIKE